MHSQLGGALSVAGQAVPSLKRKYQKFKFDFFLDSDTGNMSPESSFFKSFEFFYYFLWTQWKKFKDLKCLEFDGERFLGLKSTRNGSNFRKGQT